MDPKLLDAARVGDVDLFRKLIKANPDILLQITPQQNTALHLVARYGHKPLALEIYIRSRSLLIQPNKKGETPIHIAAKAGNSLIIDFFIRWAESLCGSPSNDVEKGVNDPRDVLRMRNIANNTALHEAVQAGHLHVAVQLMTVDPELLCLVNKAKQSPLYLAAREGSLDIVQEILARSPMQVPGGPNGRTPLHAAVVWGHFDIMMKLLEQKPDLIKQADTYGSTPLHYAAYFGKLTMVHGLLQTDTSIAYLLDNDGYSPIHMAAINNHTDIIQELILRCPDSGELLDRRGRNVLHIAVERDKPNVVEYILKTAELEELINEPDSDGNTPLHVAIINRHLSIVYLLAAHDSVDMRAVNREGLTALDIALADNEPSLKLRKFQILRALISAGAQWGKWQQHIRENRQPLRGEAPTIESYKAMANTILVVAALIATVTFAAAFTLPGGYSEDSHKANLTTNLFFKLFIISDTTGLFSSITVSFLLIRVGIGDQDLLVRTLRFAMEMTLVAVGSMALAFVSGVYLVVPGWLDFAVGLICCISLWSLMMFHSSAFSTILQFLGETSGDELTSHVPFKGRRKNSKDKSKHGFPR
ncbi:protein ACCELERATED CELL DEATH 6-like [Magnolia sinica]|uniref:protein ACCELERATED CELL DEATH 6-like n=1 Tax=Magnolia sinica TaxID=86752 RepID=UPI002657D3AF|nr:protein ACCELERATED CELL DEATH 6-like [Magnolia sinica]